MSDSQSILLSGVVAGRESFVQRLRDVKAAISDVRWYPYDTIAGLPAIESLTRGLPIPADRVLYVGAADGDLSFLFAEAGAAVHAIENEQTNYNRGQGLRRLNQAFGEKVNLTFADIDFGFELQDQYDLCFAMGIGYHLRNIFLFYMNLAEHCRFMVTNTRVLDVTPKKTRIGNEALAYLLDRREVNDDPTNFWLLSPEGYRRVLKRSGWTILREAAFGESVGSLKGDKRMWAVCERVPNYADLRKHHDF